MMNKLIELPDDGKFLNLLYFNYQNPCSNPVECRAFICNNFFDGIYPNAFAIKLPNKDYKSNPLTPYDGDETEEVSTSNSIEGSNSSSNAKVTTDKKTVPI